MLESNIKRKIMTWLRVNGWKVWKVSDRFASGRPDIYACRGGRSVWLELKRPGLGGTKLQNFEIDDLRRHGVEAYLVHSLEEAQEALFKEIYLGGQG